MKKDRCSCNRPLWYCDSENPDIPVCAECSRRPEFCWCPYMSDLEHEEFLKHINELENGSSLAQGGDAEANK